MVFSKAERTRGQVVRCFTSRRRKTGAFTRREKDTGDGMGWGGEKPYHVHEGRKYPHCKAGGTDGVHGRGVFFSFSLLVVIFSSTY